MRNTFGSFTESFCSRVEQITTAPDASCGPRNSSSLFRASRTGFSNAVTLSRPAAKKSMPFATSLNILKFALKLSAWDVAVGGREPYDSDDHE